MVTVADPWFLQFQNLAAPQAVENTAGLEQTILSARVQELQALLPNWTVNQSDPVYRDAEASTYRETILRQYFNARLISQLLRYATGSDLDNIGVTQGVIRREGESDEFYRLRIPASKARHNPNTLAGLRAFIRETDGRVYDVQPIRRNNRVDVDIYLLTEDGSVDLDLNNSVLTSINSDTARPIQRGYFIHSAVVLPWHIDITLTHDPRYSAATQIEAQSRRALYQYIDESFRLGEPVTLDQVQARATVPNVLDYTLNQRLEPNLTGTPIDLFPLDSQVYQCFKGLPTLFDVNNKPQNGVKIEVLAVT